MAGDQPHGEAGGDDGEEEYGHGGSYRFVSYVMFNLKLKSSKS